VKLIEFILRFDKVIFHVQILAFSFKTSLKLSFFDTFFDEVLDEYSNKSDYDKEGRD